MSSGNREFNPNQVTFDEGLVRIQQVVERVRLDTTKVVTSRQDDVAEAIKLLTVSAVPGGFRKWQLPVYLNRASQLFITVAEPDVEVPEHAHEEGDGIRFIVSGSITYDGEELSSGDWMYIPQGQKYSFKVGPRGATMCYCYCCCCAGRADLFEDVINPPRLVGP
ncbi:cupin domain-containing protein [Saccharothrix sp. NPDC042600]|uniref:cupin domain-containing protein n=1 Tax=Saccharothrix TaxID=2071 RepID=UPI0033ED7FA4|nr:hypothetical protein GCM10017745_30860 [Saccharothrix mutabilis subsp. capreolus]